MTILRFQGVFGHRALDQYTACLCTNIWYSRAMKLSHSKTEALCRAQGRSVSQLLDEAGVSRNSYYSLARKEAIVPRSVLKLAVELDVPVSALLDDILPAGERMRRRQRAVESIVAAHPDLDRDNVRHTLTLLDEDPLTRMRRALRRGRARILR